MIFTLSFVGDGQMVVLEDLLGLRFNLQTGTPISFAHVASSSRLTSERPPLHPCPSSLGLNIVGASKPKRKKRKKEEGKGPSCCIHRF